MADSLASKIAKCKDILEQLLRDPDFISLPPEQRDAVITLESALPGYAVANFSDQGQDLTKQDIWERRLLDLSFRNSLLNIRLGQRTIELETDNIQDLIQRLKKGEDIPVNDLPVKGLYRFARTSIEESGANTLFLAFGILCFTEAGSSHKIRRAPILLFPVELVRSRKNEYTLRMCDEDPVLNITLAEYLKQAEGVEIPSDLFYSSQMTDLETVISGVEKVVSKKDGWLVERKCVLGVFSFTKFVLWNDIHTHREVLSSNQLLKSLIEGRLLIDTPERMDARVIDRNYTPDSFILPMPYDSSQLEAVAESDRGTSFIMYGPPGTGKSQTITNIISNALYKGKRVLFVAEKKAALEVVQRRLEGIGVGPFCLELHSNKVDKRSFLRQMEKVLSSVGNGNHDGFKKASSKLYARKTEIIKNLESLHYKGNSGWSLIECIEGFLSIKGPIINIPKGWSAKCGKEDLGTIRKLCLSLDAGPSILGMSPSEHPLYGLIPKEVSDYDKKSLPKYLEDFLSAINTAEVQEVSEMNQKFLKKSAVQILFSDYRWRKINQLIDIDKSLTGDLQMLKEAVGKWATSLDQLPLWQRFLEPFEALRAEGLGEAVDMFNSGMSGAEVHEAFLKGFYLRAAQDKIDSDKSLSRFNGMLFSQVIDSYMEEVAEFQKLTSEELVTALVSRIHERMLREPLIGEELTYLKKRIASKGRGATIRGIMERIPNLMRLISPCMLMSPLSVAQYLPIDGEQFDLVVFDEASQMPTSEAVGTIARAKSVIVTGDPKQMPPTDFFSADVVDDEEYEIDDLDSILEDCMALSMHECHLKWHYRSRHESLIAFSNKEYYEGSLVTFPSVDNQISRVVLKRIDGVYDYGKTRCNTLEAKEIVKEVVDRLVSDDPRSLGIIAFSKAQSDLIEDLLLESLAAKPGLESKAFNREEPLFVKNLENVQGDERDVILFSIGYGPDESGRVSMNFGPLNKMGGERRLNVALTRARDEMVVFTSMDSEIIDPRRTNAEGALGLKRFLKYAEKGELIETERNDLASGELLSQIVSSLSALGYTVHTGVGASSFKVDLAVVDPKEPGRYCLGIIVDGENYYKLKTVRDREIVRISMLKNLGWKLCRVWTLDWFLRPEAVVRNIIACLSES